MNINRELTKKSEWLKFNKLSLNANNYKYIKFSSKNNNLQNHPTINNIDDIPVQWVTDFNFLGFTLDEHVTCKHIEKQPIDAPDLLEL